MSTPNKPPTWFWIVSIVGLVWNIIGVLSFIMHMTISAESIQAMPEQERQLYTDFPVWVTVTFCIAVVAGTVGNILLLLRKRSANPLLIISFIAILLQMVYTVFLSKALEVHGPQALGIPTMVVVFGALLIWVSRKATTKGWVA